jgi:protein tyrosine phosphatase (PTP) superfamily phosphohydrolase (DUF442 family)
MSELNNITNFVQLTDDVGTSGQPKKDQFKSIADEGFRAVVNLALPSSDHAIPEEGSVVTGLGMSYFHIPVDFKNPTLDDLRTFIGTMEALKGKKIWVHCVVNMRVSAFMYLYLKYIRQLDEGAARSPILEAWKPKMDETWKHFISLGKEDIGLSV